MSNKELFENIKEINKVVEEINEILLECNGDIFSLEKDKLDAYGALVEYEGACLDFITVDNPRWKHYHAFTLKGGYKRNNGTFSKYWIEFN